MSVHSYKIFYIENERAPFFCRAPQDTAEDYLSIDTFWYTRSIEKLKLVVFEVDNKQEFNANVSTPMPAVQEVRRYRVACVLRQAQQPCFDGRSLSMSKCSATILCQVVTELVEMLNLLH